MPAVGTLIWKSCPGICDLLNFLVSGPSTWLLPDVLSKTTPVCNTGTAEDAVPDKLSRPESVADNTDLAATQWQAVADPDGAGTDGTLQ